jgi:hypothetical protein
LLIGDNEEEENEEPNEEPNDDDDDDDEEEEEEEEEIELSETVDVSEASNTDKQFKPFGVVAPNDYRFPGYFAFACFGPTRGAYFLDLLNPAGNSVEQLKDGKKTSRVA